MISPGKPIAIYLLWVTFLSILTVTVNAGDPNPKDTLSRSTLSVTPRINSTGHFPFTGALINHHINADINIFYERRPVGFFVFWSKDLVEKSIVNYLQPGVFATLQLSSKLKVRAFFGYLLSQAESFHDPDSDYYTAGTMYLDLGHGFRIENTALFYDLTQGTKFADRLLLVWQKGKVKVDFYLWHRMVLNEDNHATSAMLALIFPQIRISNKTTLLFSSSYQAYLTANRPSWALEKGFLFSLAVPIAVVN